MAEIVNQTFSLGVWCANSRDEEQGQTDHRKVGSTQNPVEHRTNTNHKLHSNFPSGIRWSRKKSLFIIFLHLSYLFHENDNDSFMDLTNEYRNISEFQLLYFLQSLQCRRFRLFVERVGPAFLATRNLSTSRAARCSAQKLANVHFEQGSMQTAISVRNRVALYVR